jgi:UDP-N-acetylglucosamine--N-acetylmuramyl-(pentapeptide) pyrophosphoryl-undecaprenol N-acetylglucosamine transferase
MNQKRLIFSGGGTAGHLYPGLVVSEKLKEKNPDIQITFVGGSRRLEKNIMDHHGVHFIPLKIEGLKGKGIKIFKSLLILPFAFMKSLFLLIRIKPHLVIGLGGYSSGPIVLLASLMRTPTLILEQNVFPGFTNRTLVPRIQKAVVAFEGSLPHFKGKGVFLGNPARSEFYSLHPKKRNSKLSLLIFGGSQGSHFLNTNITSTLPLLKDKKNELYIYHQTGSDDLEYVRQAYSKNGFFDVEVAPYFYDMPKYFQKSDLIISRAGATTLAELIASHKAALLIPFAKATDNHQVQNALELKKIGGAEIILESEFTPEYFSKTIISFMDNKDNLDRMEKNLVSLKNENSAENISKLCWDLMENGI